jgi:hypothetical protein
MLRVTKFSLKTFLECVIQVKVWLQRPIGDAPTAAEEVHNLPQHCIEVHHRHFTCTCVRTLIGTSSKRRRSDGTAASVPPKEGGKGFPHTISILIIRSMSLTGES